MEAYPNEVSLYHSENMSTITKMNHDEMNQFVKKIVEELYESEPLIQDFLGSD
jgi:hypothetical protein